jgi:hypothetical protein
MPSAMTRTNRHSARSGNLEDEALERLIQHLRGLGHDVELRARPDREPRSGRAVDGELQVDGRAVAVEVTQLLPGARAHYEIAKLERALQDQLEAQVRRRRLGYVAIAVHYRRLPAKREIRAALPALTAEIVLAMQSLKPDASERHEAAVATTIGFIRRLELIQLPNAKPGLGWVGGSDEFGGWIDPIADNFVDHLLETKPGQTDGLPEAWIVIVDRVGLVDASNVAEALGRNTRGIPSNWTRIWFLPATDRSTVLSVPLPSA